MEYKNIYCIEPESEEELEKEKEMILKNAYAEAVYAGISRSIDFEWRFGHEDKRQQLAYMVNRYTEEHMVCAKYLQEALDLYNRMAEAKYGKQDPELMEQARITYAKHMSDEEDWTEGEPVYAWKDNEDHLVVEYTSGKRWHYEDLNSSFYQCW